MDFQQQRWKTPTSWNHTVIWLSYESIILQLSLTCIADSGASLVRVWASFAFCLMSDSRLYCHLSNEENNLFAHIFGCFSTVAANMLSFSAFSLNKTPERKMSLLFTPSRWSAHLLLNLSQTNAQMRALLHCTKPKFPFHIYRKDPASENLTRNLRIIKSTFLLSCLTKECF